jgi:hypothetical protein
MEFPTGMASLCFMVEAAVSCVYQMTLTACLSSACGSCVLQHSVLPQLAAHTCNCASCGLVSCVCSTKQVDGNVLWWLGQPRRQHQGAMWSPVTERAEDLSD